jgi:hypothetical protein
MTSFTKSVSVKKETSETEYWLELAQGADLIALDRKRGAVTRDSRAAGDICGERPDSKIKPLPPHSAIRIPHSAFLLSYLWRAAGQQNHVVDPHSAIRIPHSAFSAGDICGERPDSKITPLTPIPQSAIHIPHFLLRSPQYPAPDDRCTQSAISLQRRFRAWTESPIHPITWSRLFPSKKL